MIPKALENAVAAAAAVENADALKQNKNGRETPICVYADAKDAEKENPGCEMLSAYKARTATPTAPMSAAL